MVAASQAVVTPISEDRYVVKGVKALQVGEQMANEPRERRDLTNAADRDFQVMTAPSPFKTSPGCGETLAEQWRDPRMVQHFIPEIQKNRLVSPPSQNGPHALWKTGEQAFVGHRQFLEWLLRHPVVDWN